LLGGAAPADVLPQGNGDSTETESDDGDAHTRHLDPPTDPDEKPDEVEVDSPNHKAAAPGATDDARRSEDEQSNLDDDDPHRTPPRRSLNSDSDGSGTASASDDSGSGSGTGPLSEDDTDSDDPSLLARAHPEYDPEEDDNLSDGGIARLAARLARRRTRRVARHRPDDT
jgi:hypothetical protein